MMMSSAKIAALTLLLALLPAGLSAQTKKPAAKADAWRADTTKLPKRQPVATSCAQYGAGFVRLPGSDTCVRMGGSVEVGVGGGSVTGR